jgi:nitroimidazol reductase NimA-like FMN-containing flavoprotein (pyridoxamine 5'-phosphate oxidase superfamily)
MGSMDATEERNVDRHGLEVLPPDECWELVARTAVGRIAIVEAGEPLVFPVTHGVHQHRIVFRTGSGSKLDAAQMNEVVAFEVDDWDPVERTGWSVLVRGVVETVYEDDEIEQYEALGTAPWLDSATEGTWIRILPQEISGRRLPG